MSRSQSKKSTAAPRSIEWGGRKRRRAAVAAVAALALVGASFAAPRTTGSVSWSAPTVGAYQAPVAEDVAAGSVSWSTSSVSWS